MIKRRTIVLGSLQLPPVAALPENQNFTQLFQAAPYPMIGGHVIIYLTHPEEVSLLPEGIESAVTGTLVLDESRALYNPTTGVSEFTAFANQGATPLAKSRKELLRITDESFRGDFRPYGVLSLDPMRSLASRQFSKSIMHALPNYPVTLAVGAYVIDASADLASSQGVGNYWYSRFNPEVLSQDFTRPYSQPF